MLKNSFRVLGLVAICFISGCADYMNNLDTVTLEAGDSHAHNRLAHAKEPFNPDSSNVRIDADGRRTANAMEIYKDGPKAPPSPRETDLTIDK